MTHRFELTFGRKIYSIVGLCFVGFLGITIMDTLDRKNGLEHQKELQLQYLREIVVGVVKEEYAAAQSGKVTTAEAQKHAAARVGDMRYGQGDYFFINDYHPT